MATMQAAIISIERVMLVGTKCMSASLVDLLGRYVELTCYWVQYLQLPRAFRPSSLLMMKHLLMIDHHKKLPTRSGHQKLS